jgi:MFS family permease
MMEKYNVRYVSTIAGVLISAGLVSYANATQIWHFYVTAAVVGAMGAFAALNVVPLLINKWFVKHRNLAVGIAYMFTGIAGAIFNPLFASISKDFRLETGIYGCCGYRFNIPSTSYNLCKSKTF